MDLKLELELKDHDVVVGQSIPIHLTLKNESKKTIKIPFLIDSGRVTNFVLFNEKDELIGEYNGYTLAVQKSMAPDTTLSLVDLGAGESWIWDENFHKYIRPLPPGKYSIQIVYRYVNEDIEITSKKETFIVHPNNPVFFDVIRDQVTVGMLFTVLTYVNEESGEEETMLNMGYDSMAGNFIYGNILELGSGIKPILAKVDFTNAMDFDHDTYRWLAWEKDNSIYLSSIFRNEIKISPKNVVKDIKNIEEDYYEG